MQHQEFAAFEPTLQAADSLISAPSARQQEPKRLTSSTVQGASTLYTNKTCRCRRAARVGGRTSPLSSLAPHFSQSHMSAAPPCRDSSGESLLQVTCVSTVHGSGAKSQCLESGTETYSTWGSFSLYWEASGGQALLSGAGTQCARLSSPYFIYYNRITIWKRQHFSRGSYFAEYFVIYYHVTSINTQGRQGFWNDRARDCGREVEVFLSDQQHLTPSCLCAPAAGMTLGAVSGSDGSSAASFCSCCGAKMVPHFSDDAVVSKNQINQL